MLNLEMGRISRDAIGRDNLSPNDLLSLRNYPFGDYPALLYCCVCVLLMPYTEAMNESGVYLDILTAYNAIAELYVGSDTEGQDGCAARW